MAQTTIQTPETLPRVSGCRVGGMGCCARSNNQINDSLRSGSGKVFAEDATAQGLQIDL